jgi:starvation-inducible DNA-binding protein
MAMGWDDVEVVGVVSSDATQESDMYQSRLDIPQDIRTQAAELLNNRLADVIDLTLQAKQAHWNVKGPTFIALHEMFDKLHADLIDYSDLIGERIVQLGGRAEGTVQAIADRTSLEPYALNAVTGHQHLDNLAISLATFGSKVRADVNWTDELGDAGTCDLLTEVMRGVDKWLWFVESHLETPDRVDHKHDRVAAAVEG